MTDESNVSRFAVGMVFEAKKPKRIGFRGLWNDRQILYVGDGLIQYDSPTVKHGRKYPTVTTEEFEKWAGRDVTQEMPKDDWRS